MFGHVRKGLPRRVRPSGHGIGDNVVLSRDLFHFYLESAQCLMPSAPRAAGPEGVSTCSLVQFSKDLWSVKTKTG